MEKEKLTDKHGSIIGTLQHEKDYIKLYDRHGSYKGKYDKKSNKTYDEHGSYKGTGNLLPMLLDEDEK